MESFENLRAEIEKINLPDEAHLKWFLFNKKVAEELHCRLNPVLRYFYDELGLDGLFTVSFFQGSYLLACLAYRFYEVLGRILGAVLGVVNGFALAAGSVVLALAFAESIKTRGIVGALLRIIACLATVAAFWRFVAVGYYIATGERFLFGIFF